MSDKSEPQRSVLGPDCKASGELVIDGDGAIMGQFKGVIRVSGVLDLTDTSSISGTILAGAVRLGGRAEADIVAEHGVELLSGTVSTGRLFTSRLSVVDGASFDGEVVVGANAMQAAKDVVRDLTADDGDEDDDATRRRPRAATDLEVQTAATSLDRALKHHDRQRPATTRKAAATA